MKGISAIVATILLLMITIALAGTAYIFASGILSGRNTLTKECLSFCKYLDLEDGYGEFPDCLCKVWQCDGYIEKDNVTYGIDCWLKYYKIKDFRYD